MWIPSTQKKEIAFTFLSHSILEITVFDPTKNWSPVANTVNICQLQNFFKELSNCYVENNVNSTCVGVENPLKPDIQPKFFNDRPLLARYIVSFLHKSVASHKQWVKNKPEFQQQMVWEFGCLQIIFLSWHNLLFSVQ